MKNLLRGSLLVLALFSSAAAAYAGGNPAGIEVVVVKGSGGPAAFKGRTDSRGSFATGALEAGDYVVQFNSKNVGLKGNQYSIAAVGGKRAVTATGVTGDKFSGGGVAMKVEVASGTRLTGQVAAGDLAAAEGVNVAQAANVQGRANAKGRGTDSLRRIQDLSGQGAALPNGVVRPTER